MNGQIKYVSENELKTMAKEEAQRASNQITSSLIDAIPCTGADNYASLRRILDLAYDQAATGKCAQRHGQDLPFEQQPMQTISALLNTEKGMLYQAMKKIQESTRMDKDAAVRELLGAIVYCAGSILYLERSR